MAGADGRDGTSEVSAATSIDVAALARAAIGRQLYTLDKGSPNEVLAVDGGQLMVKTADNRPAHGSPVSISAVQDAGDKLVRDGELRLNPETLGHRRTSFVGALLATDPRVVALTKPVRLRLRESNDLRSSIVRALDLLRRPRQTPAAQRGEPLFDHFADTLRDDVATLVADEATYKTRGSAGSGNWAETPWVGVFDLSVTDSATRGHYLVYLFKRDGSAVYLSLNQGTTAVFNIARTTYIATLENKALEYAGLLGTAQTQGLTHGPIELGGGRPPLTPGYEAGNVLALRYAREHVPDNAQLAGDLRRMMELYDSLTERLDQVAAGEDRSLAHGGTEFEEERRERWHRRYEGRSSAAAKAAKREQGFRCRGCDVDYRELYGAVGERCVDAHHLVPYWQLGEGVRRLNPQRDFAILCSNCHRLVHSRRREPLSIPELRALLGRVLA
jgi:5-methylcytosine-specific restriction protein A